MTRATRAVVLAAAVWGTTTCGRAAPPTPTGGVDALRQAPGGKPSDDASAHRFEDIFSPFRTEAAALSADGRRLAYTLREDTTLSIVVVALDHPERATAKVTVTSDRQAAPGRSPLEEDVPATVRWMQWISPTRVVLETAWTGLPAIMAFDFDGKNARVLATARTTETLFSSGTILGAGREADTVIVRARHLYMSTGAPRAKDLPPWDFYRLNVVSGKFREIDEKDADEVTRGAAARVRAIKDLWRPLEREFATAMPNHRLKCLDSDEKQERFLVLAEATADAGAFYVYDRRQRRAWEMVRRSPALDAARAHESTEFELIDPEQKQIRVVLTMPRQPRVRPVPVIGIVPTIRGAKLRDEFSREAQAIADMGFAALQFDDLSGRKGESPEEFQHRRIERLQWVIDRVPGLHPISGKRVALLGEQNGGYVAMRALEEFPERFRGAVTIQPKIDLDPDERPVRWRNGATTREPPKPLLIVASTNSVRGGRDRDGRLLLGYVADRRRAGLSTEVHEAPFDLRLALPRARAAAFREVEQFLVNVIYDYEVRVGNPEVVP